MSPAPAILTRDLSVRYHGAEAPALLDVQVTVPAGARVALVGPNGSGKSTLLKATVGLVPLAGGETRIFGGSLAACRRRVAYLPQRGELDWRFPISVRRLVLSGRYVHLGWLRRPGRRDHAAVNEALARVGLTDLAERQIGRLSGGQQQRALLARALAQGADLLLLDEPLAAVDAESRKAILALLDRLHSDGATLVVATHDLDRLATDFDGVAELRGGRAIEQRMPTGRAEARAWTG